MTVQLKKLSQADVDTASTVDLEIPTTNQQEAGKVKKSNTQSLKKSAEKQTAEDSSMIENIKGKFFETIVIGAGISGIAAGYKLMQAGLNDFIILEKANQVGGAWRENTYPGCGCDIPSALYSFSFAPSLDWDHLFARQPDILKYLDDVADQFNLKQKIAFNHELLNAAWDEKDKLWQIDSSQGRYQARHVIFATGPLTEPKTPDIKGIASFKGEMFHSAQWNHDLALNGKRIAVIGTGASAIQFIPQIQPLAQSLTVFQRTAPWVLPKPDIALGSKAKSLIVQYPAIQQRWRGAVTQVLKGINLGLRHPRLLEPFEFFSRQLLKLQIKDRSLRRILTPNFTIGCKRLLFANNYYPALQAQNTEVIPAGLVEIQGNTLISANGERREVDVIIWGTGFEVSHPPVGRCIQNIEGQRLSELWRDSSPEAFLGTSLQGLPNAFLLLGPNILLYDSFIGIVEAQLDYVVSGLQQMKAQGATRFEIKPEVLQYYNAKLQTHLKKTVFNVGGCQSYYLDQNGRNFAAWPWSLAELKRRLSQFDVNQYQLV